MIIKVKFSDNIKSFPDNENVSIGGENSSCSFILPHVPSGEMLRLSFSPKYNKYIITNSQNDEGLTCNGKNFTKFIVTKSFTVKTDLSQFPIEITCIETENEIPVEPEIKPHTEQNNMSVEDKRIALIKELGFNILEYKVNVKSATTADFFLSAAMFILSIVSAFGTTNFLLGLKVEYVDNMLNLTTNFTFLVAISIVIAALCLVLKQSVFTLLNLKEQNVKSTHSSVTTNNYIMYAVCAFLFIVYAINLFYYKSIPDFVNVAFFISLFFVGSLILATLASGYYKFQAKKNKQKLADCEYREDFELVMKNYRKFIDAHINELSDKRVTDIKSDLLNLQMKSSVEIFIGVLTAPFLAYGVSNTLASCFPEAASWLRISGIRLSPIFLVLATFMIIFAFFSFTKAFTIIKQIRGSETIRFDGFFDYVSQGVSVFGLDSLQALEHEKNVAFIIACSIIIIEFSMNVSYFINEIGGDIQGIVLSAITALVPTALLIAETQMLSGTMFKIDNYKTVLSRRN